MSKKLLPRLIVALSFLTAAVFYLLSELMPEKFGGFNLAWAGVIFAGASGLALLISSLLTKKFGHAQKRKDLSERRASDRCSALPCLCACPAE